MILPYATKAYPNLSQEEAAFAYVKDKDSELETEVSNRVNGVKNRIGTGYRRVGYQILRDYFDGDQWDVSREAGSTMTTVNFCRMAVNNYTAFLTQEAPEIDIPPRDVKDDVEVARVKEVEQLVKDILDDMKFYNVFYEGVQNGSILGDTFLAGPFYDSDAKQIWMTNVKKPEHIRIVWKDEEFNTMLGYIYHYYISPEAAWKQFRTDLEAKGIKDIRGLESRAESAPVVGGGNTVNNIQGQEKRVLVREFWDEQIMVRDVAGIKIKYEEHEFGFVPGIYIKNLPHPTDHNGISDIEDMIDPQKSYNEMTSDMRDIIKQVAFASIFGKNLDVEEIQAGVAKIYDLGDEAEVFPDPRNTNFPFLQTYLGDTKQDIDITSGIPDVFQGGKGVRDVTGRALSVLMTPINNRIRGKEQRWTIAMKEIVKNILMLVEKYVDGGPQLVQKYYKADIFFPGTLVRDVTDELNKFIQKVQSQVTTMKNIGIASPKDEQELMKKELSDPKLIPEISRAPQLQEAIKQILISQAMANAQGNPSGGAPGQGASPSGPVLNNGQNQGGESPASARGVPAGTSTSPEAAASAAGNNPALIPNA